MAHAKPLIILDRDGVLNEIVVDEEHGTIDSPLNVDQVKVYPWVAKSLKRLNELGFDLVIATNQPSAKKKKTTYANLNAAHARVLELSQGLGATILASYICYDLSEEKSWMRKPNPGMLEQAFKEHPSYDQIRSWMVGDGITDVEAGKKIGLKTAFFGPKKCDACKVFESRELEPDYWGKNLETFVAHLESQKK